MIKKITTIILTVLFATDISNSQITIDLAGPKKTTESIDLLKGKSITLINMLANRDDNSYVTSVDLKEEEIPPISTSELSASKKRPTCPDSYTLAYRNLYNTKKEESISGMVESLKKEIKKLGPESMACAIEGNQLIKNTSEVIDLNFNLRNNQTITITILRITGNDTTQWTRIYKTPTKSPWSVMYGFSFIPNMMNPVNNYFSKADTSGKSYTVTKLNNQKNTFLKNVSPTIMVTWKPVTKYTWKSGGGANNLKSLFSNNFYQFGLVGGFSLNFASDVANANVLIGPSIIFCENLSISVGVAATQKDVLKGQYKEGDVIKDNLDFSQLHDKKYMAEWFVSVSFRFSSNPFKKADSSEDSKSADK